MGQLNFYIHSRNLALSLFLLLSGLAWNAFGSPFPATGSALLAPEKGLFFISRGFHLSAQKGWVMEDNLTLTSTQHPSAKFAIKEDTLPSDLTLETYAKRWMKDYTSDGFDFLGSRPFTNPRLGHQAVKGLVVDLLHKSSDKQLRQVIFLKKRQAVILTCVDQKNEFDKTLSDCNQMIRTFEWTDSIHPKAF
jgi:hypothetical protein